MNRQYKYSAYSFNKHVQMIMKSHLNIIYIIILLFSSVKANSEKDGIEYFETKDFTTWGAFLNAAADSLDQFINGKTTLKELTILKNSSTGETVSFRFYDIKYKPGNDGAIVVSMSEEGIVWAKTKKPVVALPFTNGKILLVSACEPIHRNEWTNIDELEKLFSELVNKHLFILASNPDLQLETYWKYYKKIHNTIGYSNIDTIYEDSLYFCTENMLYLYGSSGESVSIINDIIHLSRLLWLPNKYHSEENMINLKNICQKFLQYKTDNSKTFEKLLINYGCLIINALNHTQWTFKN